LARSISGSGSNTGPIGSDLSSSAGAARLSHHAQYDSSVTLNNSPGVSISIPPRYPSNFGRNDNVEYQLTCVQQPLHARVSIFFSSW